MFNFNWKLNKNRHLGQVATILDGTALEFLPHVGIILSYPCWSDLCLSDTDRKLDEGGHDFFCFPLYPWPCSQVPGTFQIMPEWHIWQLLSLLLHFLISLIKFIHCELFFFFSTNKTQVEDTGHKGHRILLHFNPTSYKPSPTVPHHPAPLPLHL